MELHLMSHGKPLYLHRAEFQTPSNRFFLPPEYVSSNCCVICRFPPPPTGCGCDTGGCPPPPGPQITSILPAKGVVGATTSVTLMGQGFGTSPSVNAGSGITVTINSASDMQIQASFAVSSSATGGNNSVTVTASSQRSNIVNFFVQIPTFFTPTNSGTVLDAFCTANQAFYAFVDYQLSDQAMNPITVGGLTPQESVSQNGGAYSAFASFATPVSTTTSGTFEDIPLGTCFSAPPPPNRCIPVAQKFQLLVPGVTNPFPITTPTSDTECEQGIKINVNPVPPAKSYTFGILN